MVVSIVSIAFRQGFPSENQGFPACKMPNPENRLGIICVPGRDLDGLWVR